MLEAKVQKEIVDGLRLAGYIVHSVPNERPVYCTDAKSRHFQAVVTGKLIAIGMVPGAADLVVWLDHGKIAYLEVKNEDGKQSPFQVHFQNLCTEHGMPYKVVRSLEEAQEFLHELQMGA